MQTGLSLAWSLPVIWLVYIVRAVWAARRQWREYPPDTKAFYILVAPLLTLALDLFVLSDRLLYAPAKRMWERRPCPDRRKPPHLIKIQNSSLNIMRAWMAAISFLVSAVTCVALVTVASASERSITAPNRFVEAEGIRFAYRSFGDGDGVPLVLLPHSRGNMENWDPIFLERLSDRRRVILFDNVGVGLTNGQMPRTFTVSASYAASFIRALNLERVDALGFSIGGCIAQELAASHSGLVRRLVLAGTAPRGGEGMNDRPDSLISLVMGPPSKESFLKIFFANSEASQQAGLTFLERMQRRKDGRSPPMSEAASKSQAAARDAWGAEKDPNYEHLQKIAQPTLIANGNADIMMPTVNSWHLYRNMRNAKLILYPDSAHGFLFQYPDAFAHDVVDFLDRSN